MVLHHELTVPVGRLHHSGKLKVHIPVRKIVHCRTHEGTITIREMREESPFEVVSA